MTEIASVYAVFADEEEARRIARILVEERLAACANILGPCHSIYRWQDKVEEAEEVAAIFKTRADLAADLVARIAALHSYDVPAIVVWPIADALPAYASWVVDACSVEPQAIALSKGTRPATRQAFDPLHFAELVNSGLFQRSGSVFYSGRAAFSAPSRLYILGLNPGGRPAMHSEHTVGRHLHDWKMGPECWSAYKDESWEGRPPGTYGMQPSILHMFGRLGLDPRLVPASNVVFVRSSSEGELEHEKSSLLHACWPVHEAVIEELGISTVLCFGGTAGRWVRDALGSHEFANRFVETNERRWKSEAHLNSAGVCVITVTHPSRADWRNPQADPTPLIKEMLER